jgi:Na+-driven multidrug efflux pump
MGARPEAAAYGKDFTRIMMGSSTIIMLLFLNQRNFQRSRKCAIAMKSLWIANIANIILCPVLIKGLVLFRQWDYRSCFGYYHRKKYRSDLSTVSSFDCRYADPNQSNYFKPHYEIIKSIIKIATPGIFQFVIASCSWIFLAQLVATTGGENASAGYQTA